jgi:hypothetical protein
MEMELELVLNQTSSKFFVNMTRTRGFRNPRTILEVSSKTKKELETGPKVPFEIKNQTIMVSKSHGCLVNCKENCPVFLSFFLAMCHQRLTSLTGTEMAGRPKKFGATMKRIKSPGRSA